MTLRNRLYLLASNAEADRFLANNPTCALFNAGNCRRTGAGFKHIEQALNPRESICLGFIRTIENASVAEYVASRTGIALQAPQVLLMVNGQCEFESAQWQIHHRTLEHAVGRHLGLLPGQKPLPQLSEQDVVGYEAILKQLLADQISDKDFEQQWRALPRTNIELVTLLQDIDDTLCCGDRCLGGGCSPLPVAQRKRTNLKIKAEQLLTLLRL